MAYQVGVGLAYQVGVGRVSHPAWGHTTQTSQAIQILLRLIRAVRMLAVRTQAGNPTHLYLSLKKCT